jgi:predicted alpha/beta-hydrolase family hydrolase
MEGVAARLTASWTMHWLEAADHSFHVLKSSGRTDAEVLSEIAEACGAWASGLGPRPSGSL